MYPTQGSRSSIPSGPTVYLETTHGLDFKTPKCSCHVIYSSYRLDKENPYMKKIAVCAILDELCYVC